MPWLVVLEAPLIALEQHRGGAAALDLLGDRELAGDHVAGQPVLLAAGGRTHFDARSTAVPPAGLAACRTE